MKELSSDLLFSFGKDCKNTTEPIRLIGLTDLFTMIYESDHDLIDYTKNLRSVLKYSKERYRIMKTNLPYFSCSVFDPPHRGVRNFQYAEGLVIDIDSHQPLSDDFIKKMKSDPRVALAYISPSNMGLKLVFLFDKPVTDAPGYTAVYRYFSHHFADTYHLADQIDLKNCDVSRICFICHDPGSWYNPDAIRLDWEPMLRHSTQEILPDSQPESKDDIAPSVYRQILQKLNTKPRTEKSPLPVHLEVKEVLPDLQAELAGYGIIIKDTEGIQYGAKIRVYKDKDQGELNIYTGKNGYKVVSSPRKGTHPELNEVAKHIIETVLIRF